MVGWRKEGSGYRSTVGQEKDLLMFLALQGNYTR
jgi:hypothetical protein